jgi:hypothetical protein
MLSDNSSRETDERAVTALVAERSRSADTADASAVANSIVRRQALQG